MAKYIFTNLIGVFVFDGKAKLVDKIPFKSLEEYKNPEKSIQKLNKKHKNLEEPDLKTKKRILDFFKDNQFYQEFYKKNLLLTKIRIRESIEEDDILMTAVSNIADIEKVINTLTKRLRYWYSFHNPEFSESIEDQKKFTELILEKNKSELLKHIKINEKESMGKDFSKEDLKPIKDLAKEILQLFNLKDSQEKYIEKIMKKYCPNLLEIAGAVIGAKLLEEAGSFKHLATLPATTIQLLGAEKALFRHLKNKKNRPPKYGIIFNHPFVQKNIKNSGKAARTLADKISMAVKVDYFKGQFIGDKLKKELEEKFNA